MRKLLVATLAAVFGASVITIGQPQLEIEQVELWFVELSSPPTSDGTPASALEREELDFRSAASAAGIRYTAGRRFQSLWNGLTVRASANEVPKLRSLPGVQAVYPVMLVHPSQEIEDPPGNVADLVTALKMTGADVAQQELGLTGRGVRVAVMDSGIDYDHPALGGCFGPGCRVARGFDFVGDAYNPNPAAVNFNPIPVPDPFPDDCDGHGTHVSGIIGANGDITGVAPEVTFHAYRVFGCEGPTTADIMLAAMEMTLDNRADVLNMSIGSAFQWPQYPTAQAANRLVRRGVTVVAAIGNEGSLGLYSAAAPGVGRDVIGVASFDNTHFNLPAFTVSPDRLPIGYQNASGAPRAPLGGTFQIEATGNPASTSDACTPLPGGSLDGRIALIRRGTCSFYQKAFNAEQAGAGGVVIYNNVAGRVGATVAGDPPITIPVVTITAFDGELIHSRLPAELTWTDATVSDPVPTGGLVSSFSSWGLAADLSVKPDLGAPGGLVRSTLPIEQGSFGVVSGTSMASPHVAGAVALILEAEPRADPHEVLARLQNNAQPRLWWGNPGLGILDNVHRQGAGLVTIPEAAEADAIVTPSKLALGELESDAPVRRLLRISPTELRRAGFHRKRGHRHDDRHEVTFTLGHEPALATGADTFSPTFFAAFGTVEFSSPTISIGDRSSRDASIVVSITRPTIPVVKLFGGYITLTPDNGGPVLRVPYAGYNGDYQEIVALTPTPAGFPWLAKLIPPSLVNQPNGAVFTLEGNDLPFIILHLDHQVRRLKMEVIDVATGRSFNFATDDDYIGRNSGATSAFLFAWDGTTTRRPGGTPRPVPNGTYRIELSVLKALGDPSNPAHTEEWTSPPITIARP
jgi:minor extracellular serine protease Vpr